MISNIAEHLLTLVLCLLFYYPFFILGTLMIVLKRAIQKFKKATGIGYKQFGKLGLISRKHMIHDIVDISTDEELAFLTHRSPGYLHRLTLWTARELSKFFLRGQSIDLISEQDLAYAIFCTGFAYALEWDEPSKMYRMKLKGIEDYYLFRGFYWEVKEIWVNIECSKMKIVFLDDQQANWPCPKEDLPSWNLAKLHAQVCLTFFAPGLGHNHVHFVFPSSITVVAKRILSPTSFLYRLLEPHLTFTERINYQALNIGKATNNKRSILDRYFFFWQPIPVTVEQFVQGITKKCYKYYYTNYKKHVEKRKTNPDLPVHCNFPPRYISDKERQKIPYLRFLTEYYEVIRDFVLSVEEFIDPEEWSKLLKNVSEYVPGIEKVDMVDVITTFIHQVGLVHYCDHETFMRFFGRQYGCMCIRSPYEPWSNTCHWDSMVENDRSMLKAQQTKDPLLLLCSQDVMRTRCFQNIFAGFIDHDKTLDLRLITTPYTVLPDEEKTMKEKIDEFKKNLRYLDTRFSQTKPPIVVPPEDPALCSKTKSCTSTEIYGRSKNLQIIPLDVIIRSVCF